MTKLLYNFNFDDPQILKDLIKTNHKLGELNGAINLLPNLMSFLMLLLLEKLRNQAKLKT